MPDDVTTVSGASDDIVVVKGRILEEFDCYDAVATLRFDNGVDLSILYGHEGLWKIQVLDDPGGVVSVREATDEDSDYSDVATIRGPVSSVTCEVDRG